MPKYQVKIENSSWIPSEAPTALSALKKVVEEWDRSKGLPVNKDGTTAIQVKTEGGEILKYTRIAANEVKYKID